MIKIYIASRWKSQERLRAIRDQLKSAIEVTSGWIDAKRDAEPTAEFFKEFGRDRARADIKDIRDADWLVLDLTDGRGRRGGMMFEAGAAYAMGKRVIVIGDPDCVFTQLFEAFESWEEFFESVKRDTK